VDNSVEILGRLWTFLWKVALPEKRGHGEGTIDIARVVRPEAAIHSG
jgi:hypothetical protein